MVREPVLSGLSFVVTVADSGDGSMWFFYAKHKTITLTSNFGFYQASVKINR